MKTNKNQEDSWNFEVKKEDLGHKPRAKKPLSPKESQQKLKKKQEKRPLELADNTKPRLSRSAIARRDAALAQYAEYMPPGLVSRLLSTLIDYGFLALLYGAVYFFRDELYRQYTDALYSLGKSQMIYIEDMKNYLVWASFGPIVFVFHLLPAVKFKKTLGKKMMKIRITSGTYGYSPSSFGIFLRELIVKPLSIVSIVGVLIGLKSDMGKCLHDHICNTSLLIDD